MFVCNEMGKGDFNGISPSNQYNLGVLLDIVNKTKPNLVHVQLFEVPCSLMMLNLIKMRFVQCSALTIVFLSFLTVGTIPI